MSPLLRLPPEIRTIIYMHAFSTAHVRTIRNPSGSVLHHKVEEEGATLLLVCRQTNAEAAPFKHTCSRLVVPTPLDFHELVRVVQEAKLRAISTLEIPVAMLNNTTGLFIRSGGQGLQVTWPADEVVEEVFSDLQCVEIAGELPERRDMGLLRCKWFTFALRTAFHKHDLQGRPRKV